MNGMDGQQKYMPARLSLVRRHKKKREQKEGESKADKKVTDWGKSQRMKAIKETDGELRNMAPVKWPFQSSDPVKWFH